MSRLKELNKEDRIKVDYFKMLNMEVLVAMCSSIDEAIELEEKDTGTILEVDRKLHMLVFRAIRERIREVIHAENEVVKEKCAEINFSSLFYLKN